MKTYCLLWKVERSGGMDVQQDRLAIIQGTLCAGGEVCHKKR